MRLISFLLLIALVPFYLRFAISHLLKIQPSSSSIGCWHFDFQLLVWLQKRTDSLSWLPKQMIPWHIGSALVYLFSSQLSYQSPILYCKASWKICSSLLVLSQVENCLSPTSMNSCSYSSSSSAPHTWVTSLSDLRCIRPRISNSVQSSQFWAQAPLSLCSMKIQKSNHCLQHRPQNTKQEVSHPWLFQSALSLET